MDTHIPADAPVDLFVTERLDARPRRPTDFAAQAKAIRKLAVGMMDDPGGVLPQFVELAMEITGAASAGLSLWEPDPAPGVFRWRFLRGRLAPFDGETTPRNFSPCGVTLDRDAVVLARHPERAYPWIGFELPEALLVPLRLGGAPFGTLWVTADTEDYFTRDDARMLADIADSVGAAVAEWRRQPPTSKRV
jgi:GAF domain-containing protein